MKKLTVIAMVLSIFIFTAFKPIASKLASRETHIRFFSHTAIEDITANNYKVVSTLDTSTGDIMFSISMQSFEFENEMTQEYFNSDNFLDTKKYPNAKFIGKMTNFKNVDFTKDGTYDIMVSGELTMKERTKPLNEKAVIKIEGGKVIFESRTNLILADYGVIFTEGKQSTNIAKELEVSIVARYTAE